jgi:hypothetical protein
MFNIKRFGLISLVSALGIVPFVSVQAANFGQLAIAPNFDSANAVLTGYTGGSYSLTAIAARGQNGTACIGYSDVDPDHRLILKQEFSQLTLEVDSGGNDTTLVVKGPDNTVRCAFGSKSNPDAILTGEDWEAGSYQVWVGSIDPNRQVNYTLSAIEE